MAGITPSRTTVSDRFPVASFLVRVPPERVFEIACASDPHLFHAENFGSRTPENFFTTRVAEGGLLRAPAGEVTYIVPPDQLARFAGKQRLYYALGTYGNPSGDDAHFSISPAQPDRTPFVRILPDFTGRRRGMTLGGTVRRRNDRYGGTAARLAWGGDGAFGQVQGARSRAFEYDDGYDPALWGQGAAQPAAPAPGAGATPAPAPAAPAPSPAAPNGGAPARIEQEPPGYEDAPDLRANGELDPAPEEAPGEPQGQPEAQGYRRDEEHHGYMGAYGRPGFGALAAAPADAPPAAAPPPAAGAEEAAIEAPAGEPEGFEDPWQLRQAGGVVTRLDAGPSPAVAPGAAPAIDAGTVPAGEPGAPPAADAGATPEAQGYGSYRRRTAFRPPGRPIHEYDEEGRREFAAAALQDAPAAARLTIEGKFRSIIVPIAAFESGLAPEHLGDAERLGDAYGATNPNSDGAGLSWGIVQFTQSGGMLGRVLRACQHRDDARFRTVFGEHADALLATTEAAAREARMAEVGGAHLWTEPWLERFHRAGRVREFQAAQNELAIESYVDRNLPLLGWLGFHTDRALAMYCDRAIQLGNGGGRRWVLDAVGPVRTDEQRAEALAALGHADLRAFQTSVPGLRDDGRWGPQTHAAMVGALRRLGAASPVPVPSLAQMLTAMVEAARASGVAWAHRVESLHSSGLLTDRVFQVG
ncbi:MAG: hypothetical protein AAF682_10270 [Planctomycetota bacterium]